MIYTYIFINFLDNLLIYLAINFISILKKLNLNIYIYLIIIMSEILNKYNDIKNNIND